MTPLGCCRNFLESHQDASIHGPSDVESIVNSVGPFPQADMGTAISLVWSRPPIHRLAGHEQRDRGRGRGRGRGMRRSVSQLGANLPYARLDKLTATEVDAQCSAAK
ncbi:hypothetical protein DM02DRAFT_731350 [Periconia macrospinosa]|uniref:Uncharacterized protein n=1 Tax=Periconia macrospinosa TaxID=97972 RepID=A0A2V1DDV8_9PLEO|nr:hypothetical protein DM02DRAFT_731350 [Periconia macrospinosa]